MYVRTSIHPSKRNFISINIAFKTDIMLTLLHARITRITKLFTGKQNLYVCAMSSKNAVTIASAATLCHFFRGRVIQFASWTIDKMQFVSHQHYHWQLTTLVTTLRRCQNTKIEMEIAAGRQWNCYCFFCFGHVVALLNMIFCFKWTRLLCSNDILSTNRIKVKRTGGVKYSYL